jgi:hypothetical protein
MIPAQVPPGLKQQADEAQLAQVPASALSQSRQEPSHETS